MSSPICHFSCYVTHCTKISCTNEKDRSFSAPVDWHRECVLCTHPLQTEAKHQKCSSTFRQSSASADTHHFSNRQHTHATSTTSIVVRVVAIVLLCYIALILAQPSKIARRQHDTLTILHTSGVCVSVHQQYVLCSSSRCHRSYHTRYTHTTSTFFPCACCVSISFLSVCPHKHAHIYTLLFYYHFSRFGVTSLLSLHLFLSLFAMGLLHVL